MTQFLENDFEILIFNYTWISLKLQFILKFISNFIIKFILIFNPV